MKHQGEELREKIKTSNLSIIEIAKVLGMTTQNIHHHLRKEVLDSNFSRLFKEKISFNNVDKLFSSPDDLKKMGVPFYEVSAIAGYRLLMNNEGTEEIAGFINLPEFKGAQCCIRMRGDSMEPMIMNGAVLGLREIVDKTEIEWGGIYAVVTDDNLFTAKIYESDDDNFNIVKFNKEYPDMILPKKRVLKLHKVLVYMNGRSLSY